MPDRSTETTTQEQQQQQGQQAQQQPWDEQFFAQMSGGAPTPISSQGWDFAFQAVQHLFDEQERTVRTARRMTELYTQRLILQSTVDEIGRYVAPQVAKQVLQYLKAHPEVLKDQQYSIT